MSQSFHPDASEILDMLLKKFANKSEKRVWHTLRRVLDSAGLYTAAQVRLEDIIKLEEEDASIKERMFIKAASFDFVVFSEDTIPMFAVEFDGPEHWFDSKQIRRDIFKNRICDKAKLPLLRIDSHYLKKFDHKNLLNYICERIVAYKEEMPNLKQKMRDYLEGLTQETVDSYISAGDLPFDPTFEFNIRHPFLETYNTANRLHSNFGIRTGFVKINDYSSNCYDYDVPFFGLGKGPFSGYEKITYKYKLIDLKTGNILLKDSISFSYRWVYPIEVDYNPEEVPLDFFIRTGRNPISMPHIPGAFLPEIAENFCNYLALKQIEIWAENNLKRRKVENR